LVFSSNTNNPDYHGEINQEIFLQWFENQLLKNLEEPSMIIMDNANCHSSLADKCPNTAWRKADIVNWLTDHKIKFAENLLKAAQGCWQIHKNRTVETRDFIVGCRENGMSIRQIVETVNMAVSALIISRYMDFKIFLLHYSAVNSKENLHLPAPLIRCDQLKNKSSRRVTYGNPCYSIGSKANSIYFLNDRSVLCYGCLCN
jgi:hypothetical protein